MMQPGQRITFRTHNGHYLRVYSPTTPDGLANAVRADAAEAGEIDEQFTAEDAGDGLVAIKTTHDRYLSAQPDGRVEGDRTWIRSWERWRIVPGDGGGIALLGAHDMFLVAEAGGGGAVNANRAYSRPGIWETFVTPGPPAVPGNAYGLEGQMSCDGVSFRDRNGPVNPVFLHAGDLIGQGLKFGPGHVEPAIALAARAQYHGLRSWFQLYIRPGEKWLRGPTEDGWSPLDDRARFREVLALAPKYGLKWHIAGAGIRHMNNAQENEVFDELASAIGDVGPEHFAVVEACNEVRDTGDEDDLDPRELERLIDRVRGRHPQLMYALSAYTGTEDGDVLRRYTRGFVPFVLVHGMRDGRAHDKIRHTFNNGYEGGIRRNWLQGEPVGVGRRVSATANKHELTGHVMASMAAAAAISRQWWTFMSGPGVILNDERFEDMPGFFETPKLVQALPRDLATWDVLGHSGSRFRGQRIHAVMEASPNVRADYAINSRTGEYAEITYGPPNESKALPQERATRDEVVIEQGEWARVELGRLS